MEGFESRMGVRPRRPSHPGYPLGPFGPNCPPVFSLPCPPNPRPTLPNPALSLPTAALSLPTPALSVPNPALSVPTPILSSHLPPHPPKRHPIHFSGFGSRACTRGNQSVRGGPRGPWGRTLQGRRAPPGCQARPRSPAGDRVFSIVLLLCYSRA